MPVASERTSLVKVLSTVALADGRKRTRRFLEGLSTEELRYIASYLGACLIESALYSRPVSRCQIASDILHYECCRTGRSAGCRGWAAAADQISCDVEHKMILLLEYLSSCRCTPLLKMPAGSA